MADLLRYLGHNAMKKLRKATFEQDTDWIDYAEDLGFCITCDSPGSDDVDGREPRRRQLAEQKGYVPQEREFVLTGTFNKLKSDLGSTKTDLLRAEEVSQKRRLSSKESEPKGWEAYSKGCIIGHALACGFEDVELIFDAAMEEPPKILQKLALASEFVACTFSFPNFGESGKADRTDTALFLETVAWALRIGEWIASVAATASSADAEQDKACLSLFFTSLESIFLIAATSLREEEVDDDLKTPDQSSAASDAVVKKAIGISFGNIFSSLLAQMCADSAALLSDANPSTPFLLGAAPIFGFSDFALDLGRGIYIWVDNEKNKNNNTYRAVTY